MEESKKDELQTKSMFPGWYYEFKGEDEKFSDAVLMEVVDVADNGEAQIKFSIGGSDKYVQFRQKDFQRAVKEFSE